MNEIKSINQKCLENILCHITKLAVLTEPGETDELKKLVKMSTSVSAQLLGVCRENHYNETNEYNNENCNENYLENHELTSDEIEEFIYTKHEKLSNDDFLHIISNRQIDHLQYDYNKKKWQMWDNTGKYFEFKRC